MLDKIKEFYEDYEAEIVGAVTGVVVGGFCIAAYFSGVKYAQRNMGIALLELAAKNEAKKVTIRNGDTYEIACKYVAKVIEEQ